MFFVIWNQLHLITYVEFAPSSWGRSWVPLTAMAAVGRSAIVPTPPASQCSSVSPLSWSELPERRDGYPFGGLIAFPALSLRAKGANDLAPPPQGGGTGDKVMSNKTCLQLKFYKNLMRSLSYRLVNMELGFSKQYNTETLKGFVLYSYKE